MEETIQQLIASAAIMMVAVSSTAIAKEEATPSGKEVVVEESTSATVRTAIAEEEATPSGKVVVEESTSGDWTRTIFHDNGTKTTISRRNGRILRTFTDTNGMVYFG